MMILINVTYKCFITSDFTFGLVAGWFGAGYSMAASISFLDSGVFLNWKERVKTTNSSDKYNMWRSSFIFVAAEIAAFG